MCRTMSLSRRLVLPQAPCSGCTFWDSASAPPPGADRPDIECRVDRSRPDRLSPWAPARRARWGLTTSPQAARTTQPLSQTTNRIGVVEDLVHLGHVAIRREPRHRDRVVRDAHAKNERTHDARRGTRPVPTPYAGSVRRSTRMIQKTPSRGADRSMLNRRQRWSRELLKESAGNLAVATRHSQ